MPTTLILLLVLFQLKHFLADYPFQNSYMLRKFLPGWGFVLPLLTHAGVHGVMTFLIAVWFKEPKVAAMIAGGDLLIHFIVDRVKASPKLLGRFKALTKEDFEHHALEISDSKALIEEYTKTNRKNAILVLEQRIINEEAEWKDRLKSNTFFWWSLGADQMAHHLTHYAIIYMLVNP